MVYEDFKFFPFHIAPTDVLYFDMHKHHFETGPKGLESEG
jgi:hypothetical protein